MYEQEIDQMQIPSAAIVDRDVDEDRCQRADDRSSGSRDWKSLRTVGNKWIEPTRLGESERK